MLRCFSWFSKACTGTEDKRVCLGRRVGEWWRGNSYVFLLAGMGVFKRFLLKEEILNLVWWKLSFVDSKDSYYGNVFACGLFMGVNVFQSARFSGWALRCTWFRCQLCEITCSQAAPCWLRVQGSPRLPDSQGDASESLAWGFSCRKPCRQPVCKVKFFKICPDTLFEETLPCVYMRVHTYINLCCCC